MIIMEGDMPIRLDIALHIDIAACNSYACIQ